MSSLTDVAKKAGVSIATASRVVNQGHNVNEVTRARVLKAIKELKYQPSRVAKRLRSKSVTSFLIGVVIPDIQNPFYMDVLRGVEDVAYEHNYAIIMCNYGQDEKKEKLYLDILKQESIDGLIVAPAHENDQEVIQMVREGMPIVCVDRGLVGVDVDVVVVNNREGAFNAVNYLVNSGYKRIAYISGMRQIPSSSRREQGYRDALEANGIPYDPEVVRHGDSKHESGVRLCEELLDMAHPPDAIFTGNNLITLGALETIHKRGLKIPSEVAILGFDDMYWSISLNPSLTAIRQPAFEIGRRAGELLIQRIGDPSRPTIQMTLKTTLMQRNSC